MGFFSWLSDVGDFIRDKMADGCDWLLDKLSGQGPYDPGNLDDHVDVDEELARFRESISADVNNAEKNCMNEFSKLFSDLTKETQERFPDLVDIIQREQSKAQEKLDGTIMNYVKEHLSKNNSQFVKVLKMKPGLAKKDALKEATDRTLKSAVKTFDSNLKKYIEHILCEFTKRLNVRIAQQEERMNQSISELEKLKTEAEQGQIDVDALKDDYSPNMESMQYIMYMLEREMRN